jgi:two-component system, CitB family, sensor kinase
MFCAFCSGALRLVTTGNVPGMQPPRMRFARQMLALQVGVLVLVVGVGLTLFGALLEAQLTRQYGQRALGVARAVAADPDLAAAVAAGDPRHLVQERAERVRRATGALFVVVTDRNGIRLSHPNPDQVGRRVSTDPSQALAGREVVNVERGTLGLSARGKVPLRAPFGGPAGGPAGGAAGGPAGGPAGGAGGGPAGGAGGPGGAGPGGPVVGEVSVGFDAGDIRGTLLAALGVASLFAAGALLLGVAGSALLARRLKRQTLGLEPAELAELVAEREAVLHGVGEGVLATDPDGRVSVRNDEAARLLGQATEPGTAAADLDLPPPLRAVIAGQAAARNMLSVVGGRVLVVNRTAVRRGGRDLGAVVTLRDRTDLEALTRELDTVRALTDALRAQGHEHANRLHTLSGLLQLGHHEEAAEYLEALTDARPGDAPGGPDGVRDPYLRAFLAAKSALAAEKSVRLGVDEGSWVPVKVLDPVAVTTVLGNLVDNALDAARLGARQPAWVEVELLADGGTLHLTVADSGDGVPEPLRGSVFTEGVSTKDGSGRGLGLALARQAAGRYGGTLTLADPGGAAHGAVFVARLPRVLAADPGSGPGSDPDSGAGDAGTGTGVAGGGAGAAVPGGGR